MVFLKDDVQIHRISAETNITLALEQDIEIKVLLKLTTFEMKIDIDGIPNHISSSAPDKVSVVFCADYQIFLSCLASQRSLIGFAFRIKQKQNIDVFVQNGNQFLFSLQSDLW